jgi:hypothetical protein
MFSHKQLHSNIFIIFVKNKKNHNIGPRSTKENRNVDRHDKIKLLEDTGQCCCLVSTINNFSATRQKMLWSWNCSFTTFRKQQTDSMACRTTKICTYLLYYVCKALAVQIVNSLHR